MELPSKVRFVDDSLQKAFEDLRKEGPELNEWLERAFEDIEKNAFCGIQIPKKQIPKEYSKKFGANNL